MHMPDVVTHRYDPAYGAGLNLCSLSDAEASRVLDRLRRESRPTLKPDYLTRRRATEDWLREAATKALGRAITQEPEYFFLGDFSYFADRSREASLILPLASLPADALTFTLGDSMTVAHQPHRRVYTLAEMAALFADGVAVAGFGLTDEYGFQKHFIEAQFWDARLREPIAAGHSFPPGGSRGPF
jgi:hypothetical protein